MGSFGPRARTREVILAKTRWLLRHRPMGQFRMEDVAQEAGLSRRTIYNQFDSFQALLHACFEQLIAELARNVQTDVPSSVDPEAGLSLLGIHAAHLFADERYADLARQILRVGHGPDWLNEACQRQIKAPLLIAMENQLLRHRRVFGGLDTRESAQRYLMMIEGLSVWPALLDGAQPDGLHVDDMQIRGLTHLFVAMHRRPRVGRLGDTAYPSHPNMH